MTLWTAHPECIEQAKFLLVTSNHILAKKEGVIVQDGTKKLQSVLINPLTNENIPIYVTDEVEFLPETNSFLGMINSRYYFP